MSKGPWKPETRARRLGQPPQPRCARHRTRLPEACAEADKFDVWQDKRAEARAAAKLALDALRERAIDELATRSREEARSRGAARYIGRPCDRHASGERFVANGCCTLCARESEDARCGRVRPPEKLRKLPLRRTFQPFKGKASRWVAAPGQMDEEGI